MPRRRDVLLMPWLLGGRPAHALPAPQGPVVLTLRGRLRQANASGEARFDMAMLERLPQHSITPPTPWYPAPRKFTGPLVRDLLAAVDSQAGALRAVALNDYRVDIPVDDVMRHPVVLARLLDDKPMPVRDKGPLFIIYPFDREPTLRSTLYYSRCAWQLAAIDLI